MFTLIATLGIPKAFLVPLRLPSTASTAMTDAIGNVVDTPKHSFQHLFALGDQTCDAIEKPTLLFGNPAISERDPWLCAPVSRQVCLFRRWLIVLPRTE